MNKHIIFLLLCILSVVLAQRPIFGVSKHKPLSPSEVQYYLKELHDMEEKLTQGNRKGRKHRKSWSKSSKKGGKNSWRKSKGEDPPWRAGMHWWQTRHGKKKHGSSSSHGSSSPKCFQALAYGNTDCTDHTVRYYFERESNMCRKFHYTGCGGNRNNFRSRHECVRKCKR